MLFFKPIYYRNLFYDKIKKFELSIPISIDKIIDKHNYFINFNTTGQVSEFDVSKSPDKKKNWF